MEYQCYRQTFGRSRFSPFITYITFLGATHRAAFPFYLGGNMTAEDFEKRNKEHAAVLAHQQQQAVEEQKSYKPYVKKPLNAFMLFMKENREKVMQESTLKESAAINQILGRKVSTNTFRITTFLIKLLTKLKLL